MDNLKYSKLLLSAENAWVISIKNKVERHNAFMIPFYMDKILMAIAIIYGISVAVFALYYNWLYAKTHGFIAWLLFGEIIASFKALIWPLFEFNII